MLEPGMPMEPTFRQGDFYSPDEDKFPCRNIGFRDIPCSVHHYNPPSSCEPLPCFGIHTRRAVLCEINAISARAYCTRAARQPLRGDSSFVQVAVPSERCALFQHFQIFKRRSSAVKQVLLMSVQIPPGKTMRV